MSMEHKAFLFDYVAFENELKLIVENSLLDGEVDQLRDFINTNIEYLTDPYEGEPLDGNWENTIETLDVHHYGDFALTKYYSPQNDFGLSNDWQPIHEFFTKSNEINYSPCLGVSLGSDKNYFDPGKMGSYFQSINDVKTNLNNLLKFEHLVPEESVDNYENFKLLLQDALSSGKGIYVTF